MSSPTPPPTASTEPAPDAEKVLPRVYRIACPFGDGGIVHVYYLDTAEPALIDTGVAQSPLEAIEPALSSAGLSLRRVRHTFNTHGHWDHMGGNEAARGLDTQPPTYAYSEAY